MKSIVTQLSAIKPKRPRARVGTPRCGVTARYYAGGTGEPAIQFTRNVAPLNAALTAQAHRPYLNLKPFSPSHPNAPASELSRIPGSTAAIRAMGKKAPNPKHQAPEKHQAPSSKHYAALSAWNLVLGASLELGCWCLVLFHAELGCWFLELRHCSLELCK